MLNNRTTSLILLVAVLSATMITAQSNQHSDAEQEVDSSQMHREHSNDETNNQEVKVGSSQMHREHPNDETTNPFRGNATKEVDDILSKYHTVFIGAATFLGFVFTFLGYKLFPVTLFLAGGTAAGVGSYMLSDHFITATYANKAPILIGVSCTMALIGGILAVRLRKIGTFVAGASGGVVAAIALNSGVLAFKYHQYHYIVCIVLGVVAGVLALKLERLIVILATAITGSFAATYGTKYFVELSGQVPVTTWSDPIAWAYVAGFFVVLIAGVLVQFSSTKKKKNMDNERASLLSNAYHPRTEVVNIETKNAIVYSAPSRDEAEGLPTKTTTAHTFINLV